MDKLPIPEEFSEHKVMSDEEFFAAIARQLGFEVSPENLQEEYERAVKEIWDTAKDLHFEQETVSMLRRMLGHYLGDDNIRACEGCKHLPVKQNKRCLDCFILCEEEGQGILHEEKDDKD